MLGDQRVRRRGRALGAPPRRTRRVCTGRFNPTMVISQPFSLRFCNVVNLWTFRLLSGGRVAIAVCAPRNMQVMAEGRWLGGRNRRVCAMGATRPF